MQTKQKKGFTLIELLVVIAIIGILSAIGLVALNGAREKARDAQRRSDLAQIRTALTLWFDDNDSTYPAVASVDGSDDTSGGTLETELVDDYMSRMPTPPGTGCTVTEYGYAANATSGASAFGLWAALENLDCTEVYVVNSEGYADEITAAPGALGEIGCGTTSGEFNICASTPAANP